MVRISALNKLHYFSLGNMNQVWGCWVLPETQELIHCFQLDCFARGELCDWSKADLGESSMLRRKVCQYFMYDERNKLQGISVQMVPAHTNLQRIPSFFYIYFLRVKKKKTFSVLAYQNCTKQFRTWFFICCAFFQGYLLQVSNLHV